MQQQTFYKNNIPIAISQLRSDKQIPTLSQYFDGGQCRVFKVTFTDSESWAVRVPLFVCHASQDAVIQLLESEARILQELESTGFSWAARLRGSSLTFDNAIGYPFIALTWIPGSQLSWSDEFPTRPLRNKILDQVAILHTSLIECTKEAGMFDSIFFFKPNLAHNFRGIFPKAFHPDNPKQDLSSPRGSPSRNHGTGLLWPNDHSP